MKFFTYLVFTWIFTSTFIDLICCNRAAGLADTHDEGEQELCVIFGAYCLDLGSTCRRVLRHKWGIPLCTNSKVCCARRHSTTTATPVAISGHVPVAPTIMSQCGRQQGVCKAWYNNNNCNGTIVQLACNNRWESCCIQSSSRPSEPSVGRRRDVPTPPESTSVAAQSSPGENTDVDQQLDTNQNAADQCGQQARAPRQKRIVGGSLSAPGTWPWHVGMRSALGHIHCAGTIINNTWIVTAAHCFKRIRDHSLYQIVTETNSGSSQNSYSIKRIIKHSLYNESAHPEPAGHAHKYDIALVQLNEQIVYNNNVKPVCLPTLSDSFEGRTCWLIGWGSTRFNSTEEDFRLRHVRGAVLSRSDCQSHWGTLVDSKMICFGNQRSGGGCTGDSGGGMFCEGIDGFYQLAGVISWGSIQCNTGATVLTDIAQYHSWIQETMASS